MLSYEQFIDEVRSSRKAIPGLMGASEMHNDPHFRKWRNHLDKKLREIEDQGYRIPCDLASRRFGVYDARVTPSPGQDVLLDEYRRELSDTANELDVLVESYTKYGEPQPPMTKETRIGRTAWDFAAEALGSWTAIALVCFVCLVIPLFVHLQAEPGSEVSLFYGLIKYQKAKPIPPPPQEPKKPSPRELDELSLPEERTLEDSGERVPILDRALNVTTSYPDFHLGGYNIELVKLAARSPRGESLPLRVNRANQYIEVGRGIDSYV